MQEKSKKASLIKLEELFGIDLRSLALLRMGLALIVIGDLINRSFDLRAHYTDFGVLPRKDLIESASNFWHVSIHLINGSVLVQSLLFLAAGVLAVALFFGYRTRLVVPALWFLTISLHSRNLMINQGGDHLLRLLLFWGMFLPLGAVYSFDSALNSSTRQKPIRVVSAVTVALLLQACFVYWFTVTLKAGATWKEGTAIYFALNIDQFATPAGHYLLNFPRLLKFLTYSTVYFEMLGPFLAFVPIWNGPLRTATVFLFILFHFSMGLFLHLGPFSYVSSVAWLVFLPSWFWDRVFDRLRTPARLGLKIYYDADCGFCKKTVLLLKTFFLLPETPLRAAQEEPSILADMQAKNSWVVVDAQGGRHFKFDAFLSICRQSPLFWPLASFLSLSPIARWGEKVYEGIASHRKEGADLLSWLIYRPVHTETGAGINALAAFFLIYIFLWNLRTVNASKYDFLPSPMRAVGQVLRLDQFWKMFAPNPRAADGWYVIPGQL